MYVCVYATIYMYVCTYTSTYVCCTQWLQKFGSWRAAYIVYVSWKWREFVKFCTFRSSVLEESLLLSYGSTSMDNRPLAQRCIPEESISARQNICYIYSASPARFTVQRLSSAVLSSAIKNDVDVSTRNEFTSRRLCRRCIRIWI